MGGARGPITGRGELGLTFQSISVAKVNHRPLHHPISSSAASVTLLQPPCAANRRSQRWAAAAAGFFPHFPGKSGGGTKESDHCGVRKSEKGIKQRIMTSSTMVRTPNIASPAPKSESPAREPPPQRQNHKSSLPSCHQSDPPPITPPPNCHQLFFFE